MASSTVELLETQGRGVTGALLVVGLATLYTMENWWLGWQLPTAHLLAYAAAGLLVVFLLTREIGFRPGDEPPSLRETTVDFAELVVQSVVAAAVTLFVFGVVDLGSRPLTAVRLTLVQVVPLGFGAAIANTLLREGEGHRGEPHFPRNLPVFALGAAFLTLPIAPTEEMSLIAVHAGAARLATLVVLSVAVVHLVLHEVGYREQTRRIGDRPLRHQVGLAFVVYAVALAVATGLLLGFGQLSGASPFEAVQVVVVLGFPAAVGASGAEVII